MKYGFIGLLLFLSVYAIIPNEVRAETQTSAVEETNSIYESCVKYLRYIKGIPLPRGNAIDLVRNTYSWTVGNIIIFHFPDKDGDPTNDGHVAEIIKINHVGIVVDECNFIGKGICGLRFISFADLDYFYGLFDPKLPPKLSSDPWGLMI